MANQQGMDGRTTASVEYDEETWEARVDFGLTPLVDTDGVRHYYAEVTRDGDTVIPVIWTVPCGGRTFADGTLFANRSTRRVRIALLTLSAVVRKASHTCIDVAAPTMGAA